MKNKNSVTIVGAGSSRTPALVGSLISKKNDYPLKKLVFYDIHKSRLDMQQAYITMMMNKHCPDVELLFTTDKQQAYENVDFIFCQMRAGMFEMRSLDEKIPLKHGLIGQETCGPGGFAYGMRSIGAMVDMVNDVRKYSPNAWILNYTNPAAIVGLALKMKFPDDQRILNICDQPYTMLKSFSKILEVSQYDVSPRYFGLNHFGWFSNLYHDGVDLLPKLKSFLTEHDFKPFNAEQRAQSWLDTYLNVNRMLKIMPEFVPNTYLQYYFFAPELVENMDPNFTRADEARQGREKEVFDLMQRATNGETDLPLLIGEVHGHMMVETAQSIAYDLNNEFVLMVPNKDRVIANLDPDMLIEVTCQLGAEGAKPYPVGELDLFYKTMIDNQYAYERLTCEAFFEQNKQKAIQALTLNRSVVNPQQALAVLDDLAAANHEYWTLN